MTTTEEEDDRWSNFRDHGMKHHLGTKVSTDPEPELADYLRVVLAKKSPRDRQERKYLVALKLVKLVTGVAYTISSEWRAYTEADSRTGVKTAPLRTLSEDRFDCLVPLRRPSRLDGLKVVSRPNDELPQHRCLIQVNPALCREEQQLVHNEWEPCLSKKFLKPGLVLGWFNLALDKACSVILSENHNVDVLTFMIGADKTAILDVTMSSYDEETGLIVDAFTVNILPCFTVDILPTTLKLAAPLPCFGPYIEGQKIFRQLVRNDVDEGNHVVLLTPKAELSLSEVQCLPTEDISWKLNLSFTEYHVYSIIDKYCRGLNFRHVLVLFNILREEYREKLDIINNEILVNALFNVSQKHIDNIRKTSQWVFKLLQALIDGFKSGFLPSFYLPRMNLLACYGIHKAARQKAMACLQEILEDIKKDPENILKHTGFGAQEEEVEKEVNEQFQRELSEKKNTDHLAVVDNSRGNGYNSARRSSRVANSDKESDLTSRHRRGERSDIY